MSVLYARIEDRERYATAYCPKCIVGQVELFGLVMKCKNCNWTFDPDERAFMKLRSKPDGLIRRARKSMYRVGRPDKYGDDAAKKVAAYYKNNNITIAETAKKFEISLSTAIRMIKQINGGSKPISGRPKKYSNELIKRVAIYYMCTCSTAIQVAERFNLSYDTVRWMIKTRGGLYKVGAGRPIKYGESMVERVAKYYNNTDDTMRQTAEVFNISLRTVARMIKAQKKLSKRKSDG